MSVEHVERVFVLGAGASRAIKGSLAPLNHELLCSILELKSDMRSELCEFIGDFYKVDLNSSTWITELPSIEDLLSQLDFALTEKRPLSKVYSLAALQKVRDQLTTGICSLLQEKLDNDTGAELVNNFMGQVGENDAIISLNYDLVIDKAICKLNKSAPVDYKIDVRDSINLKKENRKYNANPSFKVFKLHGSLNWLYCPHCQAIDVTMEEDGTVNYINSYYTNGRELCGCHICGVPYESVIIAPTFLKSYNNPYMNQLWRNAEQVLSRAAEIIFVGYSMPDADIFLRCMFKRAFYSGSTISKKNQHSLIRVVDFIDSKEKQNSNFTNDTEVRFKRLFKEIKYEDTGFEAYIKGLSVRADNQ